MEKFMSKSHMFTISQSKRYFVLILGLVFFIGNAATCVFASTEAVASQDLFSGSQLLRSLFALIAVCLLIALVIGKLLPAFLEPGKKTRGTTECGFGQFKIVDRFQIDKSNQLILVDNGRLEKLLFSSSVQGLTLIGRVDSSGDLIPPFPSSVEEETADALPGVLNLKKVER